MIVVNKVPYLTIYSTIFNEGDFVQLSSSVSNQLEGLSKKDFEKKFKDIFGHCWARQPSSEELVRAHKEKGFDLGSFSKAEKQKIVPFLSKKMKERNEEEEKLLNQLESEEGGNKKKKTSTKSKSS